MGPVGLRYSDTGLLVGSGRSLRLRAMPFVTALRILALALVIVAAARPQTTNAREVIRGEGVDIVIAIDISGSMGQTDFEPHRLGAAREIVADFIRDRRYDRIGLVVFSREAFIQSPPTPDHELLLRLLSDVHLADELGIEDGTALGSGMATAANMLKDSTAKSRVVTLITDGVNNAGNLDPVTAATAAGALGVRVYTIGVGSEGESVESPLDEETLRQVATITNAKFYRAANVEGLRDIYADISAAGEIGSGDAGVHSPPGACGLVHSARAGPPDTRDDAVEYHLQKDALRQMNFGAPYMLFALLAVPALAGFVWWAFGRRAVAVRRIGEPALVALLSAAMDGPMRRVRLALWFVGVVLLIVALARPQWGSDIEIVETRGLQIMVVLDVSRSMLAADVEPTRLDRAKLEVADLVSRLDGDAVGIALFSGASFVQLPLTTDYATARAYLNNARPSSITRQGTVIGEAIGTAMIGFSDKRESQKVIVIMSDGEIHEEQNAPDPIEAARQASGDGTVIYTVGFGSPEGAPIPKHDERGNVTGPTWTGMATR